MKRLVFCALFALCAMGAFAQNSLALVPAGSYYTGIPAEQNTIHKVTITKPFFISKYEISQREYEEIMGTNPSYFAGDDLPVECVSWFDAVNYCNARSAREGLSPAYTVNGERVIWNRNASGYRLPTEAEWVWAAKGGGLDSIIYIYSGSFDLKEITMEYAYSGNFDLGEAAWYGDNSGGHPHPVGTKAPNSLGIYDMFGNVHEWCWDLEGDYSTADKVDPVGAATGWVRIAKGGSWEDGASPCQLYIITIFSQSNQNTITGFRVVRNAGQADIQLMAADARMDVFNGEFTAAG
jgi:formylglycine-generating enzyme required for sulfatase activity